MDQHKDGHRTPIVEAVEPAARAAADYAERKKTEGVAGMSDVAEAVHRAAEQMEGQLPTAAHYVREAAAGLEHATSTLRDRPIEDVARSIGDYARERPLAFLGGAVLAGFALSRFLKSSARHDGQTDDRGDGRARPGSTHDSTIPESRPDRASTAAAAPGL